MKKLMMLLAVTGFMSTAYANESAGEKASATGNNMKRSMKKGGHKVQEAMCAEGDAKCAAKKAGHRMEEGADYTKDKAKEGADKVDADGKPRK